MTQDPIRGGGSGWSGRPPVRPTPQPPPRARCRG
jgi:hypothetical protein